ncbi:MAG: glycosyl hydrolase [Cellvibrio sp.]|uniref:glycoside hydrolase family 26 protein n=1 Tax=Cellvibrio sp. TaxID=1965322 RepID=UPI0031A56F7B
MLTSRLIFRPVAALLMVSSLLLGCDNKSPAPQAAPGATVTAAEPAANHHAHKLIDKFASAETLALYNNLAGLRGKHMLFGHEDSLAYGVNWEGDLDRSDIRDVTGSNPALYGWELGGLELGHEKNLDGVNFKQMQDWIKAGYSRGGVITISWHMYSPVSGGNSWDKTPTVHDIIPGGSKHDTLKAYLDTFVAFNEGLAVTDAAGNKKYIPIIFRPWHEHNGDWFWWGKGNASEQDYIALWQFTVKYLRDEKGLHNLIYAYSPDRSRIDLAAFESGYFYAFPGDEYVDVIGLDNYWDVGHNSNTASADEQKAGFVAALKGIVKIAQVRNKIAALTETGNNRLTIPNFWTERVLNPILAGEEAQQITYMMVWRNANSAREKSEQFFAPYTGQTTAEDFKTFFAHPYVLFESELPKLYE